MTRIRAWMIIRETYPQCRIEEVPPNPDIDGKFMFWVEGITVWVTPDSKVEESETPSVCQQ